MGKGAAIKTALTYIKEMNLVQRMSIFTRKTNKQTIDNILSNAAKSRMSAMTAEYNKLILQTKGAL